MLKLLFMVQVYGLPWGMTLKYEAIVGPYREKSKAFFRKMKCWGRRSGSDRV